MRPDRLPRVVLFTPEPVERAALDAQIRSACAHGVQEVLIAGPEPTGSAHLLHAIGAIAEAGRRPVLLTDARALTTRARLDHLHRAGLHEVCILLPADRARWARPLQAAEQLIRHELRATIGTVLTAEHDERPLRAADRLRLPLRVFRSRDVVARPPPRLDNARATALEQLWLVARETGVPLVADDLGRVPGPQPPGDPVSLTGDDLDLFGRGVLPQRVMAGADLPADLRPEALTLASWGVPLPTLPPCLGGTAQSSTRLPTCAPCPAPCTGPPPGIREVSPRPPWHPLPDGARVHIVMPWLHDEVFVVSTLPALARALDALGAKTTLHHAYDLTWDPTTLDPPRDISTLQRAGWRAWRFLTKRATPIDHYTPPEDKLGHPSWWEEDEARARSIDERLLNTLDLADADAVVVPGYATAARILHRIPPRARLVIADFHMLQGVDVLSEGRVPEGDRASQQTWWPDERVHVHACFARYARLYRGSGVPLRQVHWRPYPLFLGHFGSQTSTADADYIFSGGRHFRDMDTLFEAAAPLQTHPIRLIAGVDRPAVGILEPGGTTSLPEFVDLLRNSRFVVLPLLHDIDTCAGLTILSMAHAAGRPVIASYSGGTLDHIRDGVDGLLVPPGDPAALADAISRLDGDADLLATLSEGAREAGRRLSVDTWAREILGGAYFRSARA